MAPCPLVLSGTATSTRRAFTLIELLVVISIIALLIGILLPVLGSARETARMAKCLSNMRQMGISSVAYAGDYDDTLPTVGFSHGGETFPEQGAWFFLLQDYAGGTLHYRCPSDDSPAWDVPDGTGRLRRVGYATSFLHSGLTSSPTYQGLNVLHRVPRTSATVYIAELAEESPTGFATSDHFHPETWFGDPSTHDATIGLQLEIRQHAERANYTFLDGHAENAARSDIFEVDPAATLFNPLFVTNRVWADVAR